MDLLKTRDEAYNLANSKYHPNTTYSKYISIYLAATSNVKGILALYKDYNNVLTVDSTGTLVFEALLHGTKNWYVRH